MSMDENTVPVFFVTTSSRKADHLKYLSKETGLRDSNIQIYQLSWEYQELQSDVMKFLMSEALGRPELDKIRNSLFIIEQTSVFFDTDEVEGPGQYFKKWWKSQDQERLEIIVSRNPGVTVESGLAINIPGGEELIFKNTEKGIVKMDGEIIEENKKYSWLSTDDFSSYFSPDGSRKVYTEMEIDEFKSFDFRRPNFEKIAQRLKEYSALLRAGTDIKELQSIADEYVPSDELDDPSLEKSQNTVPSEQTKLDDL